MLHLLTNAHLPMAFMADTPETMILLFRVVYWYTPTNAAYMRRANRILGEQGRGPVNVEDEARFLVGMQQEGVIRMIDTERPWE